MDKTILWYLIILWLIFEPILTFANHFWGFRINISAPLATGFPCYFILGYLLGEVKLTRFWMITSVIIWLLATLITIIGTYVLSLNADQFDPFFYDFVTANVIFASASAFILLKGLAESKVFATSNAQTIFRQLATGAFGIYLIHVIVLEVLSGWIPIFHINSFIGNALWSVPLVGTIVFSISFVIVSLLQKIPVIQQIVP
jgi:hypothetical protein